MTKLFDTYLDSDILISEQEQKIKILCQSVE